MHNFRDHVLCDSGHHTPPFAWLISLCGLPLNQLSQTNHFSGQFCWNFLTVLLELVILSTVWGEPPPSIPPAPPHLLSPVASSGSFLTPFPPAGWIRYSSSQFLPICCVSSVSLILVGFCVFDQLADLSLLPSLDKGLWREEGNWVYFASSCIPII